MKSSFHSRTLSCHFSATANFEGSTQFSSFAPKFISWQAGYSKLDSSLHFRLLSSSLWIICALREENTTCIVTEACLLIRCLAVDGLLLRALAPAGICLSSRCLTMCLLRQYLYIPTIGDPVEMQTCVYSIFTWSVRRTLPYNSYIYFS
jgi:hypothetical protein